jgi:hypothetical protein
MRELSQALVVMSTAFSLTRLCATVRLGDPA